MRKIIGLKNYHWNSKGVFAISSFLFVFFLNGTEKKFDSYISGATDATTGTQEYYEAHFITQPHPLSTIYWIVNGGTIIDQNIDPNNGAVYCVVEWTPAGDGYLSINEDIYGMNADISVRITDPCYQADAGSDVTICSGNSTTIGTSAVSGYSYAWYPTTGLNNPNIAQPTASPTTTTTYTLTMFQNNNLLQNGDFELGNTGFSSDYLLNPNALEENTFGRYAITSNPSNLAAGWCNISDNTSNGSLMLVADGSQDITKRIWFESVSVTQNSDYYFSGFAYSIGNPDPFNGNCPTTCGNPILDIKINGTSIVTNLTITYQQCTNGWTFFQATWNSGNSTNATIEIRSIAGVRVGNDVALDDLKFNTECPVTTDQITVNIISLTPSVSPAGPITYYNLFETMQHLVLTSSAASSYQWYKNNIAISGATAQTYTISFQGINDYTDYYKVVTSCGTSNTVTFNYIGCYVASDYPVSLPGNSGGFCQSSLPITLYAPSLGAGATYSWWTYWSPSSYSFSNFSGNTCSLFGSSPYGSDGIYTKSSNNGQEIYMYYSISSANCRVANPNNTITKSNPKRLGDYSQKQQSTTIYPNPGRASVTIKSLSAIDKIEIFNESGMLVDKKLGSNQGVISISVEKLPDGIYFCKVFRHREFEVLKLIVKK
jgi:hypothetical protein